ncbi:rRNA maturation RNase YbeY [Ferruginibacter sp.]
MPIQFFFLQDKSILKNRAGLKAFLPKIFRQNKKQLSNLTYIFCSDDYLLSINKAHLQHDFYTDIITFDLSEIPRQITGEIYISTDRVRENAATLGVSIKEELHRVIFHGALHLCGYRDKSARDEKGMRDAENHLLNQYFQF